MTKQQSDKTTLEKPSTPAPRHRIRAFLQPTGGAGKTTIAVTLTQHINAEPNRKALPIDLDPESTTLSDHKALGAVRLDVMNDQGEEVDQLQYTQLLDIIIGAPRKGYSDVILDAGASGFRGLKTWLITQNAFGFLASVGWEVELHYVLPGNGRKTEAYEDLEETLASFPNHPVTLWMNPILENCKIDGREFTQTELYARYKDRFAAIVNLRPLNGAFRDTFTRMLQHGMTYEEASAPAATLIEDIRTIMLIDGARPTGASTMLSQMPPGLNDGLAPNRVFTIKQWISRAIQQSPGVL